MHLYNPHRKGPRPTHTTPLVTAYAQGRQRADRCLLARSDISCLSCPNSARPDQGYVSILQSTESTAYI